MTIVGSVDHHEVGSSKVYSVQFTNIFRFLSGQYAAMAGIQRIAYNVGSAGTGIGYWDESTPFGSNAWGLWKFANAATPFYLLVQYAEPSTTFGSAPGSPGALGGSGAVTVGGIGWAVALREDGLSPWNGTTNNNGADTKGTPVWTAGVSSLYVWPRSNSTGGSFAASKQDTITLDSTAASPPWTLGGSRLHILASEENVLFATSKYDTDTYSINWFGRYVPTANSAQPYPYAAFGSYYLQDVAGLIETAGSSPVTAGTTVGTSGIEGGIAIKSGSTQGVYGMGFDMLRSTFLSMNHPNRVIGSAPGTPYFESNRLFLLANESPMFGLLGSISFFGVASGIGPNKVNSNHTLAALNGGAGSPYTNQANVGQTYFSWGQWIVPWDGASVPSYTNNRLGRPFARAG